MKKVYILFPLIFIIFGKSQNTVRQAEISRPPVEPSTDIVFSGLKDKSGNLWFTTSTRGVYRYDGKSFINFSEKNGLSNNCVSCICEDKAGNLWFGTNNGVFIYDGKTFNNFPLPGADSSSERSIHYSRFPKHVQKILQDKNGNFWFVTEQHGVYRYDPSVALSTGGKSFTNFLAEETLQCIAEDKDGGILIGSWQGGGVYRYDGKSFTRLYGFSDGMIFCMFKDKAGNVWVGTRAHGVDRYDGKTIINFSEKDGLHNNVICILEDTKGNMWFGSDFSKKTGKRGDVFCYNGKSFTNITEKERLIKFTDYNVWTIVEDNAGNIWLGSRDSLLLRYDGKAFADFSKEMSK